VAFIGNITSYLKSLFGFMFFIPNKQEKTELLEKKKRGRPKKL
jgi:hypothetical protein